MFYVASSGSGGNKRWWGESIGWLRRSILGVRDRLFILTPTSRPELGITLVNYINLVL